MSRRLVVALAAMATVTTAVVALATGAQGRTAAPKSQEPTPVAKTDPVPDNAMARVATGTFTPTVAPQKPQRQPSTKLELPDGTLVDALNGAVDVPPLKDYWGPFPWSPIVGVERSSAGVDWYKHADGSYSTTEMVMRTDLGRKAAMTRVAHPGPTPARTAPTRN